MVVCPPSRPVLHRAPRSGCTGPAAAPFSSGRSSGGQPSSLCSALAACTSVWTPAGVIASSCLSSCSCCSRPQLKVLVETSAEGLVGLWRGVCLCTDVCHPMLTISSHRMFHPTRHEETDSECVGVCLINLARKPTMQTLVNRVLSY